MICSALCFRLCESRWQKVTAYETDFALQHSYKQLYMILDNGTLTFSADPHEVSELRSGGARSE